MSKQKKTSKVVNEDDLVWENNEIEDEITENVEEAMEVEEESIKEEVNIVSIQSEVVENQELMNAIANIKLKYGEVVFVELDKDGNESNPAKTSEKTFNKAFLNAVHKGTELPKFKLKKK